MKQIPFFEHLEALRQSGTNAAVATVIRTKGSTPRKTGTKMIVLQDGSIVGTIGGGCGEGEVIEKAFHVMKSGIPTQHRVDLTKGLFYEDGGICGGVLDVFIEPVNTDAH